MLNLDIAILNESDVEEVLNLIHHTMLISNVNDYGIDVVNKDIARINRSFILERASFTHFYVFRDQGRIVATGAIGPYWDSVDEYSFFTIFVHPDYQGRGVGRIIIETLEKDDYYLAAKRVEIPSSITAVNFYKNFGYHCIDSSCTPSEHGIVRMQKFRRKVEVLPYDEKWIDQFNSEKEELLSILGIEVLKIEHIGSTSIPGLSAKPTIDVLVVVRNIECIDHFNPLFESKGYSTHSENGIAGRRYFSKKDGTKHLVHVHIYDVTNEYEINRHIAFRDYLIHHPNKSKDYGDLKEDLAVKYPFNIEGYIEGKHELVQRFTDEAMSWFDAKT